jgi:aryl-phospho-beta-D-glucosidase BglC (GH1 family)
MRAMDSGMNLWVPVVRVWAVLAAMTISTCAVAAEHPTKPRVFVDFEDESAIRLSFADAKARRIAGDDGQALEIVTGTKSSYPSVSITRREGKWDLSGSFAAEMDVFNPEEQSLRVLLSISNPGSDGQKNNNTGSVTVPANGKATLHLPFGTWHGAIQPIDQSNIVSVAVLLDRPKQSHRFVVDNIRVVPFGSGVSEELMATDFFKDLEPVLGRGVNLGNMLEAPREGAWGVRVEEEYFDLIQSAGFDSVRIPVRWSAHAAKEAPYTIDPEFFDRVEWVVKQALSHRLFAVLNMHHYEEIFKHPDEHEARYLAIWKQIAERFKDCPGALYFELLNEPHDKLGVDKWNKLIPKALAVVRQTNPTRNVVVGPADWNSVKALQSLVLPEGDENLIGTFHYYSPFQFTHQGAGWTGGNANKWLGTKWTGTPAERQAVINDLDKALAWSVEHRIPVYMGEFGAYSKADMESRARWTRFVAEEAAKRKIGFGYWEFCAGFGVYDPDKKVWREPLKEALLKTGKD